MRRGFVTHASPSGIAVLVVTVVVAVVLSAACPKPSPKTGKDGGKDAGGGSGGEATLFFTGDVRGEIEPCGCNSNPLGDLSRLAALIEDAGKTRGKGAVAWLDAGSLLYSEQPALSQGKREQERLKADLIVEHASKLGLAAAGLGAYDLSDGKDQVRPPRQAANVTPAEGVPLEIPRVLELGGVKVGVFGLAAPDEMERVGVKASDPVAAARSVVPALRKQGAQVIVALTQLNRADARKLAQENLGIDFIVAGRDTPDPSETGGVLGKGIEKVGSAQVIVPARRGQTVVRVDVHADGSAAGAPLVDAYGEERAKDRIAELAAMIAQQEQQVARYKADPSADARFVAGQQKMIDDWKAESADLAAHPLRRPATGSWFTATQVAIQRKLRCDPEVVAAKRAFDKAAAAKNLAAAAGEKPRPVPAGSAGYAGIDECESCHKKAVDFWKTTHHAQAWATLEHVGKEADRYCVSCHVTGWDAPGGATLIGVTKQATLRNVQCEACHGPASRHVDSDGKERTTLTRKPAETLCTGCHQKMHSDTFEYQAYLRDVTGPGHGEAFRKSLGDGATGHALRQAALDKAAQAVGEGCDR